MTTLKDRVRAATSGRPAPLAEPSRPAQVVQDASPCELHAAEREEGGATDAALEWLERYHSHDVTKALPAHVDTAVFFAAVREVLPSLARCTPASVLQAVLTCARFGLVPDGRHAVIKPDGPLAVAVPMYQGYVELMYRSGRVGSVHVGLIHEHDEWTYEPTAPPPDDFTHRPRVDLPKGGRGRPILAYAFCWMTSGARSHVVLLSREDAEEIRDEYSEAYRRAEDSGRHDSFWHTDFDWMWQKSALRRLHKLVPLSAELVALGKADDAGDAGTVQVVHAPAEDAQARADAEAAHKAAEGPQEPAPAALARRALVKRSQPKRSRSQPKRSTRKTRNRKRHR